MLRALLILLTCCLLCGDARAEEQTEVSVILALPPGADQLEAQLRVNWGGAEHRIPMERAGDGHRVAELQGQHARMLPLSLWVRRPDQAYAMQAYANIEQLEPGRNILAYGIDRGEPPYARRFGSPQEDVFHGQDHDEARVLATSLAWNLGIMALVAWLAWRTRRRRAAPPTEPKQLDLRRELALVGLWIGLAAAWTWPAVLAGGEVMVGRHYDLPGSIWTLGAAKRLLWDFQDPLTGFPMGASYVRLDSFTLLPFSLLSDWVDPARIHGWLQVLGVASMAWAAERFALAAGARRPWSLLAGAGFAMSGMAANVLLEGHVYHVMDPWLALFAWSWWQATRATGRWWHGLLAGLFFFATLLTTAYMALIAAVMASVFFFAGLASAGDRIHWKPAATALATVLALVIPYMAIFVLLGESRSTGGVEEVLMETGTHLAGLASPGAEVDRGRRSKALALSGVTLALFAVAPILLRQEKGWRRLALAGVVLLLMAFGTGFGPNDGTTWFPMPLKLLQAMGAGLFVRFPIRFAWGWLLCAGVVAAWAGSRLEARAGRFTRILVVLALLEPFLMVRLPFRQAAPQHALPEAYRQLDGPILDLFPDGSEPPVGIDYLFTRLACYYQNEHGQPIADDCIATRYDDNPRYVLNRWFMAQMLAGDVDRAFERLEAMGFAYLVVHADLFQPGDLLRLRDGLLASGKERWSSEGGGEWLEVVELDPEPAADPVAVFTELELVPARAIGAPGEPAISEVHTLRIELVLPQDPLYLELDGAYYVARLQGAEGDPLDVPLRMDGMAPMDSADDFTLVGYPERSVPGALELLLLRIEGSHTDELWSGPVRLKLTEDCLTFRIRADDTRRWAWPVAAAPIHFSPPADYYNGRVASIGWALWLLILVGFWAVVLRWKRREREASS